GAAAHATVTRVLDGAVDILALVVEASIDLVKAVGLRPAPGELRPVLKPQPRRPAIAAAGELAEAGDGRRGRRQSELQAADFAGVVAGLRMGRRGVTESGEHYHACRKPAHERDGPRHFFIGSHCRVSLPQKSTQSS